MTISPILLNALRAVEPSASFSGSGTRLTSSSEKSYYAKLGAKDELDQYNGEAESLRIFEKVSPGLAPKILSQGVDDESGRPFMVTEYMDLSSGLSDKAARILAERLATQVHAHKSDRGYGFQCPTFCGATRFANGWFETWSEAFDSMFTSLVDRIDAKNSQTNAELVSLGREISSRVIPHLLGERLKADPVFLHGDLWSGNVGVNASGEPAIYDPASYFGHNEADLAIARMFGGFPSSFFTTYHEHIPKTDPVEEYPQRAELYELFHYLNHTLLFGGSYASGAKSRMKNLIKVTATAGSKTDE